VGVRNTCGLTFGIISRRRFVTSFIGLFGFISIFDVTCLFSLVGVGVVFISFTADRGEPGFCIFGRNTIGFNRRIQALTDALAVRLATSGRLGTFTLFIITTAAIGTFTLFAIVIIIVAPAATTTIFFVITTVARVGTVIATTVARVGTVIAAIVPSAVIATARRASSSAIIATVIATTQIASAAVISSTTIVATTNPRQGIECRGQNNISITIDHAEIGSCERIDVDIIFAFRAQLERAASGSTTFSLRRDTSQGSSIITSHNLVDRFGLESINADDRLLEDIPNGCKDHQAAGTFFTLRAISTFRTFITLGALTAITAATAAFAIFSFSIFSFSIVSAFVAFSFVCSLFLIGSSRFAFAIIGIISFSNFFFRCRRRSQSRKADSQSCSLVVFCLFNCRRFLAAFGLFL